jgi:DNA-binding IclR family transcriptional regulator
MERATIKHRKKVTDLIERGRGRIGMQEVSERLGLPIYPDLRNIFRFLKRVGWIENSGEYGKWRVTGKYPVNGACFEHGLPKIHGDCPVCARR